jgi:hypothetical protein
MRAGKYGLMLNESSESATKRGALPRAPQCNRQTADAAPRMKWKMMETTANIRRMWIKNAVTWNTKNPPSHSRSKTNPRTRNIVRLFLTFDVDALGSEIRSTRLLVTGDVTTASGVPAVGE